MIDPPTHPTEPSREPGANRSRRKLLFLGRPDFSSIEALREFAKRAAEAIRQAMERENAETPEQSDGAGDAPWTRP